MTEDLLEQMTEALKSDSPKITPRKQSILKKILAHETVSRNVNKEFCDDRSLGERVADRVAAFGGSWTFIFIFGAILVSWIILNSFLLTHDKDAFDPYPYILLNLFLSMIAALQAPVIMMSQKRQSAKDRLAAEHDYEVNLKSELEIRLLHEKLDELRESRWDELVRMQQEQIEMLTCIITEQGSSQKSVMSNPDDN